MSTLPSGTVTFLFTDIEGSTKLAWEYPQSWEPARARHHDILRRAIDANNGFVFQIIGDAFCAAFHKPWDALRAAIESQQDLQGERWGEVAIRTAECLAAVAAGTGQAAGAILLAGGAHALRQAIGIPLSAMAQADFDVMLAPARNLLGAEAVQAIWSKGLDLTIDQTVAEAKEVI